MGSDRAAQAPARWFSPQAKRYTTGTKARMAGSLVYPVYRKPAAGHHYFPLRRACANTTISTIGGACLVGWEDPGAVGAVPLNC